MTKPKTNKLEDSKLWQESVAVAEKAHNYGLDFPENDQWTMAYKLRGRSFDLTAAIADAEGSSSPRDTEWFYGQARTALFALKNVYHVARKVDAFKVEPEEMVHLNKLIAKVDKEIAKAHADVVAMEAEEMKRRKAYK